MKKLLSLLSICVVTASTGFSQTCEAPKINSINNGGVYCPGTVVQLEIDGSLGDAEAWQWSTGKCGETVVQVGPSTTLEVTVNGPATYYVQGIGGCVGTPDTDCKEVMVDIGPEITACPDNILQDADDGDCGTVMTFEPPTALDKCTPAQDVVISQTRGLPSGSVFPVGVTEQVFVAEDALGNKSECRFTVEVVDNQAPVITCPADLTVDNDPGECGALVNYDLPAYSDNCPGAVLEQTGGLGTGAMFPVGTTIESYSVTDGAGNTESCEFSITVVDVEPPLITLSKDKTSKWPPNHKPFTVEISNYIEDVTDNCPGITRADIVIYEVSSDEPNNGNGDGNTSNDIVIGDDCRSVALLAERQGGGNGRVYTITLAVSDEHGNVGFAYFYADIPHDKGKKGAAVDDGPIFIVSGCDFGEENEENRDEQTNETDDGGQDINSENIRSLKTFPNPFSNNFDLSFTPDIDDVIEIDFYSLTGIKVKRLFNGPVKAGKKYSWTFDASSLNEMLYLVVIKGERSYAMKKILRK